MNLNNYKQNRNQFILCTNCNREICLLDYPLHKDKCHFRQTFHSSHNNDIKKELVARVDPNYSSLSSFKTIKIDKYEKNKEDNYKRDQGYFNMNDAIVTFGNRNNNMICLDELESQLKNKNDDEILKNNWNVKNLMNTHTDYKIFGIENKLNDNNSYFNVNIQVLWSMRKIKRYIINDIKINTIDGKNKILQNLQNIFIKLENSVNQDIISITDLRKSVAESFQSRRKFLMNYPDDPVDLYFAFINSLHSFYIKSNLNEIKDTSCDLKCAAHKYSFMDISRLDRCNCKGSSKRLYSYHNYIFDIHLKKILSWNNHSSLEDEKLYSLKGNLFNIYRDLISNIKSNCPEKGSRCCINKTKTAFLLHSSPEYMCFNLKEYPSNRNLIETLKTLVIIPKYLNLSNIFSNNNKETSSEYELLGIVCITHNKHYTCINRHGISWFHFEDEKITPLSTWNQATSFLLKKAQVPIMLYYEKIENISNDLQDLTEEDIEAMTLYCKDMSRLKSIFENKFRPNEDFLKFEDCNDNNNKEIQKEKETGIIHPIINKNKFNQCNVCGVKIIHSDNSNFTCFCLDKQNIGHSQIHNEQSKNTIDLIRPLKNIPSKSSIKLEDKNTPSKPSATISEKEKITKNVSELLHNKKLSKEIFNHIQDKVPISGLSIDKFAPDKNEINLPKQMNNKHNLIQDEPNSKKPSQPLEESKKDGNWTCIVCGTFNKSNNYKCSKCNNKNFEILERICRKDLYKNNEKLTLKEDKLIFKNTLERGKNISDKNTPKNHNIIHLEKKEIKSNFHQNKPKATTAKTESLCICYKLDEDKIDTLFNNNICRICGRKRFDSLRNPDDFLNNKYKSAELTNYVRFSNQEYPRKFQETKLKNENSAINNYVSQTKHKLKINTKTDSRSFAVISDREKKKKDEKENLFHQNKIEIKEENNSIDNKMNKNSKIISSNYQQVTFLNKKIKNFGNDNFTEHFS